MSTARLRPHSSRLSDVTQTPLDTGDRSKSCQGMLTCTQKWGHSVREGECPTQRKRLSSESSCCPGGEEERCFTSPGSPPPTPASITKETGNRSFCPGTAFLLSVPSSVEHTEAPCRALDTLLWWSSRKVPCYQLLYSKRPEGGHGPRGGHDWAHAHSWEGSVSVLEQSVPTGWCSSLCSLLENSPQGLLACWWPWVRHPEKPFQLPQTGLPGYSGVIAHSLIIDLIKGLGNKFLPFPHAR